MGYLKDIETAGLNIQDLKDAMEDLKNIALKGDITEKDYSDIAADYDLNVTVLKNKFKESHGSAEAIRNVNSSTDANSYNKSTYTSPRSDKAIDDACKRYGVPHNRTIEATWKGKPITAICRTRGNSIIAVDNVDAQVYKWGPSIAHEIKFKEKIQDSSKD